MTRWIGIGVVLLCVACSKAPEQPAKPQPTAAEPVPVVPADMPGASADQLALTTAISAGRNDAAFCDTFQATKAFSDWSVKISDFRTSTVNQSIDITFDAGDHVQLEQVVQTSDPLYPTIQALRMRDSVQVSGTFTHGNGECGFQLGIIGVHLTKITKAR